MRAIRWIAVAVILAALPALADQPSKWWEPRTPPAGSPSPNSAPIIIKPIIVKRVVVKRIVVKRVVKRIVVRRHLHQRRIRRCLVLFFGCAK